MTLPYAPFPAAAYGAPTCRLCGAAPALAATVHGHRGLIVLMQFRSLSGPFCRDCGIAAIRHMSAQTLWQGWWGLLSFVITPVMLGINLVQRIRLDGLADPARAPGSPPPMDKGRPLYRRPAIVGVLVPVVAVAWFGIVLVDAVAGR